MATWSSNGQDTGGSGSYNPGTQGVQYLHDNFAATGDTISLPTGTFTWATGVTLTKSITVKGSSYTPNTAVNGSSPGSPTLATIISSSSPSKTWVIGWNMASTGTNNARLTGISFTGITSTGFQYINFGNSPTTDSFRIDNCSFDTTTHQSIMMLITGNGPGVIDHCTLNGGAASEMIHNQGFGSSSFTGWLNDVTPGSGTMLFIEDCIGQLNGFSTATNQTGTSIIQNYYGATTVLRYCTLNMCQLDTHGNVGINGRWTEVYNCLEYIPSTNTGQVVLAAIRGGSGVIYNNGFAAGSQTTNCAIVLYTDEASSNNLSPAVSGTQPGYGPGAGIFSAAGPPPTSQGATSSPVYLWNNNASITVGTQIGVGGWTPSPITLNSSFYVSSTQPGSMIISQKASQIPPTTYSYAAYTYPHPLTGLSTSPGSGLTAATDSSITKYVVGVTSGAYSTPANNYVALYSNQFTSSTKAGATEWSSASDTTYARQAMGATGSGWTIAAYVNGTGVVWSNTNAINFPAVASNAQTLYSIGFCDALTVGNINFFCDLANSGQLTVPIGFNVFILAGTGAVFTID